MPTLYRSILVPLDGTPFAEQALPLAVAIARRHHAILHLALVHRTTPALVVAGDAAVLDVVADDQERGREHEYLAALTERLSVQHRPISSVVLEGTVTDALESHIDATLTDLVVTTTHGRGHLARFWLGSVADHLMRHVAVPVVLVRPSEKVPAPDAMEKVLVALDGSAFAEQALKQAAELARAFQIPLELLCVVEPSLPIADPVGMVLLPSTPESERALLARASSYLEAVAEGLRKEGVQVTCTTMLGVPVATAILEQARKTGASMIALATHGLGGLKRILLGSVADQLVHDTTVPVMVIRPVPESN